MNLKYLVLMSVVLLGVMAHASRRGNDVLKALVYGAEFDVAIRVVDDVGHPVAGVKCSGWMAIERAPNHGGGYERYTGTNGFARIVGRCGEWFTVIAQKDGYYTTTIEVKYPARETDAPIVDGKWQPYGETRTVVLKKIKNPIRMVEAPYRINKGVSLGTWYGYDLVNCDWMPPHGQGRHLDVLVRLGLNAVNSTSDFCATMDLCFTNNAYSGVYKMRKDNWSEMKTDYIADTNRVFETNMSFAFERHPHQPVLDTRLSEDEYLVFRIRTQVDEDGRLISAHYGKIYGLWSFFGAMTVGEVYFNPTPNDVNLEDMETYRKSLLRKEQNLEFKRRRGEDDAAECDGRGSLPRARETRSRAVKPRGGKCG